MTESQIQAVAQVDACLNNAGLPTYSDILQLLKEAGRILAIAQEHSADVFGSEFESAYSLQSEIESFN